MPNESQLDVSSLELITKGEFPPCELMHPGSCEIHALAHSFRMLLPALKVFIPVHFIPMLFIKPRNLRKQPGETLWKCLKNVLKSCCFVGLYSGIVRYSMCRLGQLTRSSGRFTLSVCVLLGSFAIAVESPRRRTELALFLLPRALEAVWSLLKKWKTVKAMKRRDEWVFAGAMGLLLLFYQSEPHLIKASYLSVFQFLFGDN